MRAFAQRFGLILTFAGFSGMPFAPGGTGLLVSFFIMLIGILLCLFEWPLKD